MICCAGWVVFAQGEKLSAQNQPRIVGNAEVTVSPYPFPLPGREVTRDLTRALKSLEQGKRLEALRLLQGLIDLPEDYLMPPENMSEPLIDRTLRRQVLGILAMMPRETIVEYEVQYGGEAAAKINEIRAGDDWSRGGELSLTYLFTRAGRAFTEELGLRHLDHGEFASAELLFERLLISERAWREVSPRSVILAAYCVLQEDEARGSERAREILKRESEALQQGKIEWGGETWDLPMAPEKAIEKLASIKVGGQGLEIDQWVMPRQSGVGNSGSNVGPPALVERWNQPTAKWKEFLGVEPQVEGEEEPQDPLDDFFQRTANRNLPLVPAGVPLIVEDAAIFRTVRQLHCVDLKTGKTRWMSAETDESLAAVEKRLTSANQQAGTGRQSMVSALEARVWGNLSHGALSSDGARVYSIEDLPMWGNSSSPNNLHEEQNPGGKEFNRLLANDVRTGKVVWEMGGPGAETGNAPEETTSARLRGWYFLGPPLPLNGTLYVLAERKRDVHLVAIDPVKGELIWSQTLLLSGEMPMLEYAKRCQGLTPVAAEGILLCPTGMQALVGMDLTSRSIVWGARNPELANDQESRLGNLMRFRGRMGANRRFQLMFGANNDLPIVHRWLDPYLQLTGDRVLHAPIEGDELRCLELRSGKTLWEVPRGKGVFVAGERNGTVVIVERELIEGVSLETGERVWREPIVTTAPAGRGYFEGGAYHLPLMNGELVTIDVERGMVTARRRYSGEKPLGNLVAARGMVVSQSYDTVSGFRTVADYAIEQGISDAMTPVDAPGWALRGLTALYRGEPGKGYGDFRRAWGMGQEIEVRDVWLSSLLEGMRIEPETYREYFDPADANMALGSRWGGLWAYQMSGELLRREDFRGATELLLSSLRGGEKGKDPDRLNGDLAVRREDWVAGRLLDVFRQAPVDVVPQLEGLIQREWERRAEDHREQRRFQMVVRDLRIGNELAGIELSREPEKLTLDRELWLLRIFNSGEASLRPKAAAQLARGLLQRGDRLGAVPYLRKLNTEFTDRKCRGDVTGWELLQEWERDPVLKMGARREEWPEGKLQVVLRPQGIPEPMSIHSPPLFLDLREPLQPWIQVMRDRERLRAVDPAGEFLWEYPLAQNYQRTSGGKWYYAPIGSLMIATNVAQLVGIDLTRLGEDRMAERLWSMELIDPTQIRTYNHQEQTGMFRSMPERPIDIIDSMGGVGGQLLCCSEEVIAIYREESLWGLDPLTGEVRWRRYALDSVPTAICQGRSIFANLDPQSPMQLSIFSSTDGRLTEVREWNERLEPPASEKSGVHPTIRANRRLDAFPIPGGIFQVELLTDQRRRLSLADPETMKIVWEQVIETGCALAFVEGLPDEDWRNRRQPELAILKPGGNFEIVDLSNGETQTEVILTDIEGGIPGSFMVITTPECDLVLLRTSQTIGPATHVHQRAHNSGRLPYDGTLIAIERKTNGVKWKRKEPQVSSILEVSAAHPVLAIQSYDQEVVTQPMENSPPVQPTQRLTLVDRRSGREIYGTKYSPAESSNLTLMRARADRTAGVVRLTLQPKLSAPQQLIEVKYTNEALGGTTPDIQVSTAAEIPEIPPAAAPE